VSAAVIVESVNWNLSQTGKKVRTSMRVSGSSYLP